VSTPDPAPDNEIKVSPEFFLRVNDMIAMANRIGKRYTTAHAQLVMMHAVSRYSAYHYRSTVKADSKAEREKFAIYMGNFLAHLVADHMEQVVGPISDAAPADGGAPDAGAPDVAPSAEAGASAPEPGSTSAE